MKIFLKSLLGLVVTSLVALVVLVPKIDLTTTTPTAEPISVSVEPKPLAISCPGAFVEFGGEAGVELGQIDRIGESSISVAGAAANTLSSPLVSEFTQLQAEGSDQSTALLSANQAQVVDRQRASGLAAAFCEQPSTSGWFISGQSSVGAETALLASNPNPVDTQLLLTLYLPGGEVQERYSLAPQEQLLVNLVSVVGSEPIYAIEYSALGSPVSIALQHRFSRGLTPLGLNLSMTAREPSTEQWITPITVLAEGYQAPMLRLFAPGERAEVIATVFSATEPQLIRFVVPEQSFLELPLELPEGSYALKLQSDNEVLAGVLNPSLEPLDHSWLVPSEPFTKVTMATTRYQSALALTNPNAVSISVRITTVQSGREQLRSVVIPPLSMTLLPASGEEIRAESASQFFAALQISDPLGYAVINPSENRNLGSELSILVR